MGSNEAVVAAYRKTLEYVCAKLADTRDENEIREVDIRDLRAEVAKLRAEASEWEEKAHEAASNVDRIKVAFIKESEKRWAENNQRAGVLKYRNRYSRNALR